MDSTVFGQLVARVERESDLAPRAYRFKVALLAILGLGVLIVVIGIAGMGLFALAGIALVLALTGFKAAIVILKLGKVLLLLAWPMWVLVKSSLRALLVRLPSPQGHEITRSQAPALFAAMDDMRARMHGPRFHHVLITDDVNAAVVQRPMFGLVGWPRNYLILGLPLLESLSTQEALAVVAHEYGHLAGSHSRFAAYIYRLRLSWGTIGQFAEHQQGWASRPLKSLVGWYAPYFNAYTFVLARANEYQADAASADLVGADVAANALKRVHLTVAQRELFMKDVIDGIGTHDQPPADLAVRWADQTRCDPGREQAATWLREALERQSDLADTHPALKQRLEALQSSVTSEQATPAPVDGASAAHAWLGQHLMALRDLIQREWRERVSQAWGQRHEAIQTQRDRLATLLAVAEPDVEQAIELIRLRMQLEPEGEHLAALQDFNAAHPDHALGLFLEGDLRLSQDDESGLVILDRVMLLDPDATKPVCESAFAFFKKRRDEAGAEAYGERWRAREQLEQRQAQELSKLDVSHELRSAQDLDPQDRNKALAIVRTSGSAVKRAYLVRRVLPSAPNQLTYVIALELSAWARMRRQHASIVQSLAKQQWPMHVFICTVHGEQAALKDKVIALPGALLPT